MRFEELNLAPQILQALTACGYDKPTPIQAQTIPALLEGRDVIGSAQTGTGKTAAFVLPALHRIAAQPNAPVGQHRMSSVPRVLATMISLPPARIRGAKARSTRVAARLFVSLKSSRRL